MVLSKVTNVTTISFYRDEVDRLAMGAAKLSETQVKAPGW